MQRQGISLFDIDGPLRGGKIGYWPEFLAQKGLFDLASLSKVRKDLEDLKLKKISYKQFTKDILEHSGEGLRGQSVEQVKQAAREFVMRPDLMELHPYAKDLVKRMNQRGISVAITGQPYELAEAMMNVLPFHLAFGTEFEVKNGKYSGKVKRNMALEKGKIVKELKQHKQYWKGISYAFGDRVTDGEMLREVKKPIALNPDERMKRYAKRKGWGIAKGTQILRRIRKR